MTERESVRKWAKKQKGIPGLWLYVLSDTFGGHKKPCDVIGCYKGQFFAIEFKKDDGKMRPHQIDAEGKIIMADGIHIIGRFLDSGLCFYDSSGAHPEEEFLQLVGGKK